MTYKMPSTHDNLKQIIATDTEFDLLSIYQDIYKVINGKTISDIAQIYEQLTDWETTERIELKIPYKFGTQRKGAVGHRIWYLSLNKNSKYYSGNFFDLEVSVTAHRNIKKRAKLSSEAIKFFRNNPSVIKNELPDKIARSS